MYRNSMKENAQFDCGGQQNALCQNMSKSSENKMLMVVYFLLCCWIQQMSHMWQMI